MEDINIELDSASSLEEHGIKLINGEIDSETAKEVIEFILMKNIEKKHDTITLVVNSEGGSVTNGFAIIDAMRGSVIPVHTTGIGELCSMGLLIFMSGKKGHRALTPNTLILSHQWFSGSVGKEHELLASQRHNSLVSKMVIEHYLKTTKLKTEEQIRKHLLPAHDVWLSAKEAKKYGICDKIIELK